jgi:hypothetical protein
MTTARQHERDGTGNGGSNPGGQHEIYYWPSPHEDPVIGELTDQEAIQLAVKATQARFRRKGVGNRQVLEGSTARINRPEEKAATRAAHNLLLALLNNLSVDYRTVASEVPTLSPDGDAAMTAMDQATQRVAGDASLHETFDKIQDSYRKQFIGHAAVMH